MQQFQLALLVTIAGGPTELVKSRGAAPPSPKIVANVTPSGGIAISLGELHLAVSSTYSEAVGVVKECPYPIGGGSCALLRALGTAVDPPQPVSAWAAPVTVSGAGDSWTVSAAAVGYRINRTVTVEGHRVRIKDTITTGGNRTAAAGYTPTQFVGIEITHRTAFTGDASDHMQGAVLPGTEANWACHSIAQEEATPVGDRTPVTSSGNPTIHAHSTLGGAGMLPLDDVFETHAYGNVSAYHTQKLPVQSDPPAWRRESNVCSGPTSRGAAPCVCTVTDPPSISLVDANLVLPPGGEVYTQEWAVYPLPASCPDYYCFINSVRADSKVDEIQIPGSGFLAFYDKATSAEVLPVAGFSWNDGDWGEWDDAELQKFYEQEAIHFSIVNSAQSNHTGVCGEDTKSPLDCEGGCFLHELPDSAVARWQRLINATRRLGGGQRVHVYQNSGIDSSRDASIKHTDSAITDAHGEAVAYRSCAAGKDYPLFFANGSNSYSQTLERVYQKVVDIGFDGVYHDEFLGDGDDYTFSTWDRFSGSIHPTSKNVESVFGSIVLLTQQHEIKLINMLRNSHHSMVANGQPSTRTLREALRVGPGGSSIAGGPGGATLHFREDSPQAGAMQTHLFTPMTLNRYGGQRLDLDPKYNASCAGIDGGAREYMSALCVGRNIGDSLDFGVTTFLYDGLFRNDGNTNNILHDMYPLTARRLGEGLIVGRERVITKKNGTAMWKSAVSEWDFTVSDSAYANRNPLRPPVTRKPSADYEHGVRGLTVVVKVFGRDGLLNATRNTTLQSANRSDASVAITLHPGQVAIVALS